MVSSSKIGAVLVAVSALAAAGMARAYTIETHFTMKCHEKLTAQALRTVHAQLGMAATPRATDSKGLFGCTTAGAQQAPRAMADRIPADHREPVFAPALSADPAAAERVARFRAASGPPVVAGAVS
jgi:hypothetical protein